MGEWKWNDFRLTLYFGTRYMFMFIYVLTRLVAQQFALWTLNEKDPITGVIFVALALIMQGIP